MEVFNRIEKTIAEQGAVVLDYYKMEHEPELRFGHPFIYSKFTLPEGLDTKHTVNVSDVHYLSFLDKKRRQRVLQIEQSYGDSWGINGKAYMDQNYFLGHSETIYFLKLREGRVLKQKEQL